MDERMRVFTVYIKICVLYGVLGCLYIYIDI